MKVYAKTFLKSCPVRSKFIANSLSSVLLRRSAHGAVKGANKMSGSGNWVANGGNGGGSDIIFLKDRRMKSAVTLRGIV